MGNWRSVHIEGTCSAEDLPALRHAVCIGDDWNRFHCLCHSFGSLCGLNDWTGTEIDAVGNLAERGYSVEAVAEQLKELVKVAPSLTLRVHCGGDYEDRKCVATIVVENGEVRTEPPQIETLREMGEGAMRANFIGALLDAQRR
jgi:hypothetical protein